MPPRKPPRSSATILRHHGYNNTPRKYFMLRSHQGKERAYVDALRHAGYVASINDRRAGVKFALYDMDGGKRTDKLEQYHRRGLPIFLYPHAARPQIIWDGIWDVWPNSKCNFVPGPGHKEVMERYGYPLPIEVCGWTYCETKPFQPVGQPKRILFGPIHPSVSGWICDEDKEANQRTFKVLLAYCREIGASLTVRHIQSLERNGLQRVAGVTYVLGKPDLAIREIDMADVVVGHQTFAYLSVARGKPTLMMREDLPPHTVSHGQTVYAASWEKYADIMAYPLDILAGTPADVIRQACQGDPAAAAWRERFIGVPWEPKKFVEKLESYL